MFRTTLPIRFNDVDYAGIVYGPVYLDYFHQVFEQFFCQKLGVDGMRKAIAEDNIGFPTVRIECDYYKPRQFGQEIVIELSLVKIGDSSVTFSYRGLDPKDESTVLTKAQVTCVALDVAKRRAVPVPDKFRKLFDSLSDSAS